MKRWGVVLPGNKRITSSLRRSGVYISTIDESPHAAAELAGMESAGGGGLHGSLMSVMILSCKR